MAAPKTVQAYGPFAIPLVTARSYRRRRDGLDDGNFTVVNDNSEAFAPDNYFEGFTILEDDVRQNGPAWEHNLNCIGIKGGKPSRRLRPQVNHSLESFSTASESWITSNPNVVIPGSRLRGWPNMVCDGVNVEDLDFPGWYRVQANYRGITRGNPVKRTISANVDISVIDNLVWLEGGGDSRAAHKWAIAWPKVTVVFSYVVNGTQLKMMPQQGGSPAGPLPVIRTAINISSASEAMTYHWPNGWRLMGMPMDPIAGTNIAFVQEIWEWQQKVTV